MPTSVCVFNHLMDACCPWADSAPCSCCRHRLYIFHKSIELEFKITCFMKLGICGEVRCLSGKNKNKAAVVCVSHEDDWQTRSREHTIDFTMWFETTPWCCWWSPDRQCASETCRPKTVFHTQTVLYILLWPFWSLRDVIKWHLMW